MKRHEKANFRTRHARKLNKSSNEIVEGEMSEKGASCFFSVKSKISSDIDRRDPKLEKKLSYHFFWRLLYIEIQDGAQQGQLES